MEQTAGAVRLIYNLALEQRRDFHRQARATGHFFNHVTQGRDLKLLRREAPWLAGISSAALYAALKDLDRAFAAFWRGGGFPMFRSKHRHCSFREKGRELKFQELGPKWWLIWIPKIGFVKMRHTREWCGRIICATFKRDAVGWHVSLSCEIDGEKLDSALPAVGIDRGVANTLALSTGEMLASPDLSDVERRKRLAQRVLSRRSRGSARYAKARKAYARIAEKLARCRYGWRQSATTSVADRFGFVALEELPITKMTVSSTSPQKRGLNRSIGEQGWGEIERLLSYKLEERGGTLIKVNPAYTSQTCSACGAIDKASRESQARFACRYCGFVEHADTNAAINILRRSAAIVEGGACAPIEARSGSPQAETLAMLPSLHGAPVNPNPFSPFSLQQ
jgi:putative transposase